MLIEQKRKADTETAALLKEKARLEAVPIIEIYAAAFGWEIAENGVVDIGKSKQDLVELVGEYQKIKSHKGNIGNKSKDQLCAEGYSVVEVNKVREVVEAYELMRAKFEDFNRFVSGVWEEDFFSRKRVSNELRSMIEEDLVAGLAEYRKEEGNENKRRLPVARRKEIRDRILGQNPGLSDYFAENEVQKYEQRVKDTILEISELENVVEKIK